MIISVSYVTGQLENLNSILKATGSCNMVETKVYYEKDGFCSTSLHIDSDSTYTFESGCEGRSYVSIGKWQIVGDSLFLFPSEKSTIQPFCTVKIESTSNDSTITFVIRDKFGSSRNDLIVPVTKQTDIQNQLEHYLFLHSWKDSLSIYKKGIEAFEFPRLFLLTGSNFILDIKDLPSVISLTLNLNSAGIMYDDISYVYDRIPTSWKITRKEISSGNTVFKQRKQK